MAKQKDNLSSKYQPWVDARSRFHLTDAHIQMARELGMNPKKLGGIANHRQERWKVPVSDFIEDLYFKQFGRTRPDSVRSVEEMIQEKRRKKAERKAGRQQDNGSKQTGSANSGGSVDLPF